MTEGMAGLLVKSIPTVMTKPAAERRWAHGNANRRARMMAQ
jgi:hypothetical protein